MVDRTRAAMLPSDLSSSAGELAQFLTFRLGAELYAIPIVRIREVVEFRGFTRVPLAPPCVPGVLNLRGLVLPVVDLSARLSGKAASLGRRTCIVVVEMPGEEGVQAIGMIVDAVSEAVEVSVDRIEQRPAFGAGISVEFVAGLLNVSGGFIAVLDLEVVLSLRALEQLVTTALETDRLTELPGLTET